jgi:hypothetical protein
MGLLGMDRSIQIGPETINHRGLDNSETLMGWLRRVTHYVRHLSVLGPQDTGATVRIHPRVFPMKA